MEVFFMREKLKNELLLLLNTHVDDNNLKSISQELDVILSNYEVETRKTDIVLYNFEIPETVKMYIVTKKISGLSEKSLYLYSIVLKEKSTDMSAAPVYSRTSRVSVVVFYQRASITVQMSAKILSSSPNPLM